jgi:ABC-type nitrate/sulfonate/bicarbonate transport system ATPase subunit
MTELRLYRTSEPARLGSLQRSLNENAKIVVRVLPTMTLKTFRSKARKALSCGVNAKIVIMLVMNNQSLVALDEDHDKHDLSWIGFETGSQLLCIVH